jgi:hypothetical protein
MNFAKPLSGKGFGLGYALANGNVKAAKIRYWFLIAGFH